MAGERGRTFEQYIADNWTLHTYQVAGYGTAFNHYLLFEKGDDLQENVGEGQAGKKNSTR